MKRGGAVSDWLDDADRQPEAFGIGAVEIQRRGAEVVVVTSGIDADLNPEGHAVYLSRREAIGTAWLLIRAALIGR